MKKLPLLTAIIITGCASAQVAPITREAAIANQEPEYVVTQCYMNDHYTIENVQAVQWAVQYGLSTWDTSDFDFKATQAEVEAHYANTVFDADMCKLKQSFLLGFYNKTLNHYNQSQQNQANARAQQEQRQQSPSPSFTSTVRCQKIGAFNAPILEYSNGICPIGMLPVR
ncbi:exported hypothetical protein [Vibrio crassostreae]|nr:exported hypothetical protein [Vibrio crassostreae]CAK2335077.1 exported hypothetical protein [Vibrio crassostreae]CAK2503450.1 exported hypothetical protein [Vibrio crassostreae]CAK2911216.1 exported hypothetical protein [Vibrio crassostreae]